MYFKLIAQSTQALKAVEGWFDKAEHLAASKKFDVSAIVGDSLAPDMAPIISQVQSACDYLKAGVAWLSGQPIPKHEDNEKTIDDLRARIRKTVAFAESVTQEQYQHADSQRIKLSWAPGKVILGRDYLVQLTIPSVYFHVSLIYAVLRHNGVDVGKSDFIGKPSFIDA